jgi:hypothetical protein
MRRHYTRTMTGYKCVACRQEFSTRDLFSKHCARGGQCKHPTSMLLTIDLDVGPYHWIKAA